MIKINLPADHFELLVFETDLKPYNGTHEYITWNVRMDGGNTHRKILTGEQCEVNIFTFLCQNAKYYVLHTVLINPYTRKDFSIKWKVAGKPKKLGKVAKYDIQRFMEGGTIYRKILAGQQCKVNIFGITGILGFGKTFDGLLELL